MTFSLSDQLKRRIKEKKLNMREVERRADLRINAVRNIITGVVKKPAAHTLKAIAKVLECSVDDLLEIEEDGFSSITLEKEAGLSHQIEDLDLYLKAAEIVVRISREKGYKMTLEQSFNLIRRIYSFYSKRKDEDINMQFVEGLFEGIIKK